MKKYLENKAAGFYLTAIAAILSIASIFVYMTVMYKFLPVYLMLVLAVVLAAAGLILAAIKGGNEILNWLPVVNAVLMASAAVWSFFVMVNQIGYVIASLDPVSTITTFIIFVVTAVLAMILNIAAAFSNLEK